MNFYGCQAKFSIVPILGNSLHSGKNVCSPEAATQSGLVKPLPMKIEVEKIIQRVTCTECSFIFKNTSDAKHWNTKGKQGFNAEVFYLKLR